MKRLFKRHKKLIKNLILVSLAVGAFVIGTLLLWVSTFQIPTLESFEERKVTQSTKIYDNTGEVLLYDVFNNIKRTVVPFEDISVHIKNATIAIEDTEFYEHSGVRPLATLRAVFLQPLRGKGVQGGSTITQQVIKNSVLTSERKVSRKIKEWVLAIRLEQMLDKESILNIYRNEPPSGGSVYGVEEASRRFFNKNASEVTIAEAAYLAALPQAPTFYSPYGNNVEALENRKNLVLNRMLSEGFINQTEYDQARKDVVEFQIRDDQGIKAPHFVVYVRELLTDVYGEDMVENGGLVVTTTLDWELQQKAEEIVYKYALENAERYDAENASLVAIDPTTGGILVMVGSRDYFDEEIDGNFNIAIANRQPGSAFKPFVYAEAFKKGYTPETILFDLKTQFSTTCAPNNMTSENGCYSPTNYDDAFRGPMTMRDALAQSVNVPAIKAFYLAGTRDALRFARDIGISTLTNIDQYGLTLVLGGGEVKLLDMTSAYGVFAQGGLRNQHIAVLEVADQRGNTLYEAEIQPRRVMDEKVAYTVSDVLSDNVARTPAFGAQSFLHFPNRDVAVKTGTTNDYRDAWIVGYTPSIAVGAWAGNNNNRSMDKRVAGFIIAPLWNEFMNEALKTLPQESFPEPNRVDNPLVELKPTLRNVWIGGISTLLDSTTGKRATENTPKEVLTEIVTGGVHSILHWVDRSNPRGPIPSNPSQDAQYNLWEYPIQRWVTTQNIRLPRENDIPEEISDTHNPENKPVVSISMPSSVDASDSIKITPDIESKFSISRVEYYVNSTYIGATNAQPFSLSFTPNEIDSIGSNNTLRVVVYDAVQNKTETQTSFNVSQ